MPDCPWDVVDIVNIDVPVEDGNVSETKSSGLGSNTPIEVKPSALGACQLHLVLGNVYVQFCTQQLIPTQNPLVPVRGLVGRDPS